MLGNSAVGLEMTLLMVWGLIGVYDEADGSRECEL